MAEKHLNEKIEYVTASAGTGKTYRLVKTVHDAVVDGSARPEGIIATTFTAAAAGELRERLALRFHEGARHREALRLREGYIGTVHSICLDLLSRFAFEAGLPPEMRVLEEKEATHLLTGAMDQAIDEETTLRLMALSDRLGQRDDRTGRYYYEKTIRAIVGEARSNDIALDSLPAMGAVSWEEMQALLPPSATEDLDVQLLEAITTGLQLMPKQPPTKTSQDYRDFLGKMQRQLSGGLLWTDWLKLSKDEPAKAEIPCTDDVRLVASRLEEHPKFHADLKDYLGQLFGIASQVGDRYRALKRERGVVDFQDLEKETLDLLRNSEESREILSEEIDLLVVDEFQDTSPIQLALFSELGQCAKRVVWVGDVKQSIYEFRGADPELIRAAVSGAQKEAPLATSWRSLPDLVTLANSLFAKPFLDRISLPESETVIDAHRRPQSEPPPFMEIARITSGDFYKNGNPKPLRNDLKSGVLADLVEDVLKRGDPVTEKTSVTVADPVGRLRPLRSGDLAVLVRSHDRASALAEALRSRGIDVVIGGSGLLTTPECRLALACFRRLLDPTDSLASAEIVAFENQHATEEWLEQRIRFVREVTTEDRDLDRWGLEGNLVSPAITRLENVRQEGKVSLLSPLRQFDMACASADVPQIAAAWGPTAEHFRQREANLEQLRGLFIDYEKRCTDFGTPATTMGLFASFDEIQSNEEDAKAVDPDRDAVHVSTYHGAKGLEWPVVITADLDSGLRTRLFSLRSINTAPGGVTRLDNPLADRELRLWLNPFGRSKADFVETMEASEAGVASMKRAEEEEIRLLYVGMTRARDRLILPLEPGIKHPWLELLGAPADTLLSLEVSGEVSLNGSVPLSFRCSEYLPGEPAPLPEPAATLPFPVKVPTHTPRIPSVLVPSAQEPVPHAVVEEIVEFGARLPWKGSPDPGMVGEAMHRLFAVEILNPEADSAKRQERALGILEGYGLAASIGPLAALATVDRYRAFVRERFAPLSEQVEVPFSYRNEAGQRVSGFIDHLLETAEGPVILDHKIFPGKREDWEAKALGYSGQLAMYAEAFQSGKPIRMMIHLVSAGVILEVRCAPNAAD